MGVIHSNILWQNYGHFVQQLGQVMSIESEIGIHT